MRSTLCTAVKHLAHKERHPGDIHVKRVLFGIGGRERAEPAAEVIFPIHNVTWQFNVNSLRAAIMQTQKARASQIDSN
jgi:hypothetical protein